MVRYIPKGSMCSNCGDIATNTTNGKYVCKKCYQYFYTYGTFKKDIDNRKSIYYKHKKENRYYNKTNTCDKCGRKLEVGENGKIYREYKDENWTGNWLCYSCYEKYYIRKCDSVWSRNCDWRNGRLDLYSPCGKAVISQRVTCEVFGIKDLNIELDDFRTPIDHSRHPLYGILQSKLAVFGKGKWCQNFENEYNKEFDYLVLYCMDVEMENIIRIYIIPKKEIIQRGCIAVIENPKRNVWYEKYRIVDIKCYEDVYRNVLELIEKGNDPIIRIRNAHVKI